MFDGIKNDKLLFKRKKQSGWMAIVPTSAQINIAHVRRSVGARPEVVFCDSYRKEGSDAEALARLRKELKLDEYRCTTLLKFVDYKMHTLDAPNVPAAELKNAVRWLMKDVLDFPLELATIDVLDFPAVPALKSPERQAECLALIGCALRVDETVTA